LSSLRNTTEETATLHIRQGERRLLVAGAETRHALRRVMTVGSTRPIYAGSAGLILLSTLTDDEILACLHAMPLHAFTPSTVTDPATIVRRARLAESKGFAMNDQESTVGVAGVAVPVHDEHGGVFAALVVSGPVARWSRQAMTRHLDDIHEAADQIST